jgi:predicted RNA methylase
MGRWAARLRYAWRRHGSAGFARLALRNLRLGLRRRDAQPLSAPDAFDARYGTDTGGVREVGSLDIALSPAALSAGRYQPSSGRAVLDIIERFNLAPHDFSFVDYGSGKGRVVMIAAELPFKTVIGVEFSRELHETASRNLARLPAEAVKAGGLELVHADAALFEPPLGNLLCYFYDPFGPPTIERVALRLAAHAGGGAGRVVVVYVEPKHRAAFTGTGRFVILDDTPPVLTLAAPA